jgi:hypothetical protein
MDIKNLIKESINSKSVKLKFEASFLAGDYERVDVSVKKKLKSVINDLDKTDFSDLEQSIISDFLEEKYSKSLVVVIDKVEAAVRIKSGKLEIASDNKTEFKRLLESL